MSKIAFPNKANPCYDCGSTIPGHHTFSCDPTFSAGGKRDLPEEPGTQYWTREVPAHLTEKTAEDRLIVVFILSNNHESVDILEAATVHPTLEAAKAAAQQTLRNMGEGVTLEWEETEEGVWNTSNSDTLVAFRIRGQELAPPFTYI